MHKNPITILAINPGTRYIGIAVVRHSCLIDWGVCVTSGRCSDSKLKKIRSLILRLITEHQPQIIALKNLHPARCSIDLEQLCRDIKRLARSKGLEISRHSIQEIEAFYAPDGRINKSKLAQLICNRFPALSRWLRREQNAYNPYHIRMFEAVALATMVDDDINRKFTNL